MAATENKPEVIILLISASYWFIKEASAPRSFRHCCHNVQLGQVHQNIFIRYSYSFRMFTSITKPSSGLVSTLNVKMKLVFAIG